jgi:hypothetical protein
VGEAKFVESVRKLGRAEVVGWAGASAAGGAVEASRATGRRGSTPAHGPSGSLKGAVAGSSITRRSTALVELEKPGQGAGII